MTRKRGKGWGTSLFSVAAVLACLGNPDTVGSGETVRADEIEVTGPVAWGAASRVMHARNLWLADQPDRVGLEAAKARGVRVVINLREPSELDWNEQAATEALGLTYYNVPVSQTEPFSPSAFGRVEELVAKHSNDQVLVHCSSGNRVAGWFATHLVRQHGMTAAEAIEVGKKAGITKEAIVTKVRDYLQHPGGE